MKRIILTGLLCLGAVASAQEVHYNYDRAANFHAYKTYQWVETSSRAANPLVDQNIKRGIEEQLAAKGFARVELGADINVGYQVAVELEKQFDGWGSGPRWSGTGRVSTSTIEVGTLAIGLVDAKSGKLVWSGDVTKTLDVKKDPDKNYQNLQKALTKLFKNYPPGADKK